jgi:peptide/nickel transport system substrate-binding protein
MKRFPVFLIAASLIVSSGCRRPDRQDNPESELIRQKATSAPATVEAAILADRNFGEAPMLHEQVGTGTLPPVSDRLPKNPRVIVPVDEIGRYGGTLRRVLIADIIEEDEVYKTLTDSLMIFERPLAGGIELNLAESYEFLDDGRVALFKLRPGIRWSDGEPLTTADFLFWYEDMTFNDNARSIALFPSEWLIDGEPIRMEAVDELTLKFSASKPMGRLLHALCKDPVAYPKHHFARYHPRYNPEATYEDFRHRTSEARLIMEPGVPVLSAWRSTEWIHGQKIVYERNPYYWKIDTAGNQLPYADRLEFTIVPSIQVITLMLQNGQVDMVGRYDLTDVYAEMKGQEKKGVIKVRVTGPEAGNAYILNWDAPNPALREAIRNKNVRMALSHAINRAELSEIAYQGMLIPGGYSFNRLCPYYSEEAYQLYSEFDPDKARSLLDRAGYRDTDGDGWREFKDGTIFSLTVDVPVASNAKDDSAELLQDYWQQVGIKTNLNYGLSEIIYTRRLNGEFEVLAWKFNAPADPLGRPQVWAIMTDNTPYWHRNASSEGPEWLHEATRHIKAAMATVDPDMVHDHMVKVRDLHTENIPIIATGSKYHIWAFNTRLGNVPRENARDYVFRGWSGPLMSEQIYIKHGP